MKRSFIALAAAALCLPAAGCGWYTNIPAQVAVHSVKPGRVTYEPPDTRGIREIKVEAPVVVLQTEPGSIGVNFDSMTVTYRLINRSVVSASKLPGLQMGFSFRVDSANYPVQPAAAKVPQADQGVTVDVGKRELEFPVITRHVEQFGLETQAPEGNAPMVTAECTLSGVDDANLGVSLPVFVPIYFSGTPGSGS